MDNVKNVFDSWAGTERGERMAKGHDILVGYILDRWDFKDVSALLDVGCGNGRALVSAFKRGNEKLAGIDLSDKMIAEAKKNIPEADLHVGSMDDMSMWDDNTFSHVMSIEALYYLDDPMQGLKEIRRVLKPGGKIAVAIDYYKENKGTHTWQDAIELDLTLLSEQEWTELFIEAGFDDVKPSRIVRSTDVTPRTEFQPSGYFLTYEQYLSYIEEGALLLAN